MSLLNFSWRSRSENNSHRLLACSIRDNKLNEMKTKMEKKGHIFTETYLLRRITPFVTPKKLFLLISG